MLANLYKRRQGGTTKPTKNPKTINPKHENKTRGKKNLSQLLTYTKRQEIPINTQKL